MFLGHFALAFAAKRAAPRTSLGTLFAAAQLLDLVWPALVLAGVERVRIDPGNTAFTPLDFVSYPWTHSLVAALLWAAALALAVAWRRRDGRAAWVVAGLVASHWVLDLVAHRPDLPLAPGAATVGLGLWRSVAGTLAVELGLFAAGVAAYAGGTRARDRAGRVALWSLVAVLLVIYAANVLGPPPPSAQAVGVAGLGLWLFVAWAAFVDRHRVIRDRDAAPVARTGALNPP